jgi:nitrogen fixation-related uncharacterized protein
MRFQLIVLLNIVVISVVYLWATRTGRYDKKDDDKD